MKKRLVVGLSGASGAALCVELLEAMRAVPGSETHLVLSEAGERVLHEEMGAIILPPMLAYYQRPQSPRDMSAHIVGKILNEFHLEFPHFRRWRGG